MRIIGSVLLEGDNLDNAIAAASLDGFLVLPPAVWRHRTKANVRLDDLLWVKERFVFWRDRKWGDDVIVFGDLATAKKPESYARLRPVDYSCHVDFGEGLAQRQSRFTLRVVERQAGGSIKVHVIAENIAAYIVRGAA